MSSSRQSLLVAATVAALFVGLPFMGSTALGSTAIFVDDDNCPGPGSGTQADPYCSIQTAIDAAVDGDEIVVAPGTYFETINFLGKAITLQSSAGPAVTTIDALGTGSVVTCNSGEGLDTVLDGFTITGGLASFGGGMFNHGSDPTVTNCTFTGNTANAEGGGMLNFGSDPTVTNCTFTGNGADSDGGGMGNRQVPGGRNSSPTVTNCTFIGNTASFGGGMSNETFTGIHGGSVSPTVTNCTFIGNTAGNRGGGMSNSTSSGTISTTVTNCTFIGNTAGSGGGMGNFRFGFGFGAAVRPTMTNCTFIGNTAGSGGAISNSFFDRPTVTNCVLWSDSPNEISGGTTTVSYSDVQGGWPGAGNIDADPLFVDPDNGDFRLSPGSPCIDAGDNTAVPVDIVTDLDGNPRFVDDAETPNTGNPGAPGPIVDMGAFEFRGVLVPLDIEPGDCPNEFKPRLGNSGHKIDIALVGKVDFDVTEVDFATILLARADGVGGAVPPERVRVKDRATPFDGDPCGCHDRKKDGIRDLRMRFFAVEMTFEMELDLLAEGESLELMVTGELFDGTPFVASDCIVIDDPPRRDDDDSDSDSDSDSDDDSDDDSSDDDSDS